MSIDFNFSMTFWFTIPKAVVLSVCNGVGGCGCPKNLRTCLAGTASRKLMKSAPTLASAVKDINALMICNIVPTPPLLGGNSTLLDMKKWSPALLHALFLERYDASLCPTRTMLPCMVGYDCIRISWHIVEELFDLLHCVFSWCCLLCGERPECWEHWRVHTSSNFLDIFCFLCSVVLTCRWLQHIGMLRRRLA
jgi:hypothetical protein